jgi:hypothetical protein
MSTLPFQGGGHFQYFRPGFRFWHICHVDRHGHFTLKQLRLPVLNETHTNSYLQILDYYMEMDFPGFIPKTKYIVPCNGTLFNLQGHIFLLQGHKVCQKTRYFNTWIVGPFTWAKMSGYLRHQSNSICSDDFNNAMVYAHSIIISMLKSISNCLIISVVFEYVLIATGDSSGIFIHKNVPSNITTLKECILTGICYKHIFLTNELWPLPRVELLNIY